MTRELKAAGHRKEKREMKKPTASPVPPPAKFIVVPIEKIDSGARQRAFDPKWAEAIAATLPDMGLKQPIEVSANGERFRLIAGKHRLEAAKFANWTTISARLVALDGKHEDASAAIHEALENLMRTEITALDRMAHLGAMKEAHDTLFPHASEAGRPKKLTRASDANWPSFGQFAFSQSVAAHIGMSRSLVKLLNKAWNELSTNSRIRLQGSRLATKQSELVALSGHGTVAQALILDCLLSDPPQATTVAEAAAMVADRPMPSAAARRIRRYQNTITAMPTEEQDRLLDGIEDIVRGYAQRRGWFARQR